MKFPAGLFSRKTSAKGFVFVPPLPKTLATENTPVDVAIAAIFANQRAKELAFFADLERTILKHERDGLEVSRMVRALETVAKVTAKLSSSGGKA